MLEHVVFHLTSPRGHIYLHEQCKKHYTLEVQVDQTLGWFMESIYIEMT